MSSLKYKKAYGNWWIRLYFCIFKFQVHTATMTAKVKLNSAQLGVVIMVALGSLA
jgi:hypothetical protein